MPMDYKDDVTVKIDGLAASAACLPWQEQSAHGTYGTDADPSVYGSREFGKAIDMLDEVKESIINAYEIKTSLSRAKISHLMDLGFLMHAGTAIELGFADGLIGDNKKGVKDTFSHTFSGKAAEISILNKMGLMENHVETVAETEQEEPAEEAKPEEPKSGEPVTETPAEPEIKPAEEAKPAEPAGTPVSDLEKRLNLLK